LKRFKVDLDRLPRRMTREDIAAILYDVYRRGYHSGRSVGARQRRYKAKTQTEAA
jgi:hypothetical protein